jgi:hypothetical protein
MKQTEALSALSRIQSSLLTSEFQGNAETYRSRATLPPEIIAAMKISVYEAFPAQIFVTLIGGVFMPASGALRFSALFFCAQLKRQGIRTLQTLRLLRRARNWRLMMDNAEAHLKQWRFDEEKIWPLFRRKKLSPAFNGLKSISPGNDAT